ncbi:hypothetical protein CDAR_210781 [Caerostris darwini]|uniref:Uncharacterized protein n=1 Tax=Caerostris darwini TaxID=1538125 RepID=A0AAV4SIW4_9ARAC|nr:hypothetical protein CDAR_210781 [Caerostris darwini]
MREFVFTWVKTNSSIFKNELFFKTKFTKKKEKYDAFQFFSSDSFEKWESSLAENMAKVGWIKEGIEGYTTNLKNMMTDLYRSLEDAVELIEITRRELRDYEENEEINARELMTSTSRKVDLAFVKRQIYCEEIILLRGYLKAKFHGCWNA